MVAAALPWEWSASAWSALTFVVLVAAALVAWRQVKEAQRLREEQARPFVLIDFHAWETIIELTITNIGATLARDVRFEFRPPLKTTHDEEPGRGNLMDLNLFKHGIPSLAPKREIRLFFDQFPSRLQAGLPLTYEVDVSYRDTTGKEYSEPQVLDVAMYVGTGGIQRYGVHDIYKQLKTIADLMKKWTDWSGLKIVTRADRDRRRAAFERERAEQDARERAEAAARGDAPNGESPS